MSKKRSAGIASLGLVDRPLLEGVGHGLASEHQGMVFSVMRDAIPWPEGVRRRSGQYEAGDLIPHLREARHRLGFELLLGFTERDLFVSGLNFVFGLASPSHGVAVVSVHRLSSEFYGYPPDQATLLRRSITEASHELGHLLGLGHCPNPRCAMFFSNSISDTDIKSHALCPRCWLRASSPAGDILRPGRPPGRTGR